MDVYSKAYSFSQDDSFHFDSKMPSSFAHVDGPFRKTVQPLPSSDNKKVKELKNKMNVKLISTMTLLKKSKQKLPIYQRLEIIHQQI